MLPNTRFRTTTLTMRVFALVLGLATLSIASPGNGDLYEANLRRLRRRSLARRAGSCPSPTPGVAVPLARSAMPLELTTQVTSVYDVCGIYGDTTYSLQASQIANRQFPAYNVRSSRLVRCD